MSRCISSFNGIIEELPGIYADNFENPDSKRARAYFLSHYHLDHVQGLHSPKLLQTLKKTNAVIYTTELTVAIIAQEDSKLKEYVRGLKQGSTLITLPCIPECGIPEMSFTVTVIPAGHSVGSAMFLFRTESKTILFTGDFRINCSDLHKYTALQNNGIPIKLDALYVDTTFIDLSHENFPKRSESVEALVREIQRWISLDSNYGVAIYTPARYGYEFVCKEIYKKLGLKVYVDSHKWKFYNNLPDLIPGVTNDEGETKIHLCKHRSELSSHRDCIGTDYKKYLLVYLTAAQWTDREEHFWPVERVSPTRIDVCFATHCSRKEIIYFVDYLSPKKIVGFPNEYTGAAVKRTSQLEFERKKRRVDRKVDEDLLKLMLG